MSRTTLLVANRGEIACRILRAAKTLDLSTVAVYSEADRDLPHVAMADQAVLIGTARAADSYLKTDALLDAARQTGASLVHPGYGFLSERADFARACAQQGLRFVGPTPEVIDLMGDKERARRAAADAGVPVLPGTGRLDVDDAAMIEAAGRRVGFPLIVKAAAGGGGIGMRQVTVPEQLLDAVKSTSTMAGKAFGDSSVYLERYIEKARHVEIQVFGFGDGRAVHLFERDCSLQRRHQKVIEEARAPLLSDATRARMAAAAVALAQACRYTGAGTVEFLFDVTQDAFYFLEMNTRIQVEHPVSEMISGVDLVASQLRQALGEDLTQALAQSTIHASGHAVEARIYAENPAKNFMPSPGPLNVLEFPELPDVRFECGYRAGNKVTPFYDPMLMKVVALGADRPAAIKRLGEALAGLRIEGITHNTAYLMAILKHPRFIAGDVYTSCLADWHAELIAG
ncbi:MAG: acetyl-CoA carboxylase biotin carboxylase subunit [Janthinobacterium lividum]